MPVAVTLLFGIIYGIILGIPLGALALVIIGISLWVMVFKDIAKMIRKRQQKL